ncbi:MAG TPA: hypothetical protein VGL70_06705 [Candidatus Binatia bacterium]|jgi:hypothetical protein
MKNWRGKLKLDKEMLTRTPTYYIYRSEELAGKRPALDGIYIQRSTLGPNPPDEINAVFEWETDHPAP